MRRLAILFFCTVALAQAPRPAHFGHSGTALLPDVRLTPGATLPVSARKVCKAGYSAKIRNVDQSLKNKVYAEYGQKPGEGICVVEGCEVDHLISLELGGSNDIKNLWIQPYGQHPGAHEKDRLEDWLHEQVCKGNTTLATAQSSIASDWYQTYLLAGLGK